MTNVRAASLLGLAGILLSAAPAATAQDGAALFASLCSGQKSVAVGSATLAFQSCAQATFSYNFTGGSSSGMAGTIGLRCVGPVPAGCAP